MWFVLCVYGLKYFVGGLYIEFYFVMLVLCGVCGFVDIFNVKLGVED